MRKVLLVGAAVAALAIPAGASASTITQVMHGLDNAKGLAFGPEGALYVAEAGSGGSALNALNVMQRYAQDGDVPAVRAFAAATAPHVQEHLTRARAIRDALTQRHDEPAAANSASNAAH